MRISYDFHIHTAASPCAESEMTPNNIVHLAKLLGKDMIAITDHNTCKNCEAVMRVGSQNELIVIPGIEIECMEEFHVLALFKDLESAYRIESQIWNKLPTLENKVSIFGEQQILNEKDECVGEIKQLLLTATQISYEDLLEQVKAVGGVLIPAHIDRASYSLLSNIGMIPKEWEVEVLEVATIDDLDYYKECYKDQVIIQGSDAHRLEKMCEGEFVMEIESIENKLFKKFIEYYIRKTFIDK